MLCEGHVLLNTCGRFPQISLTHMQTKIIEAERAPEIVKEPT